MRRRAKRWCKTAFLFRVVSWKEETQAVLSNVLCAPKRIYFFSAALTNHARPMIPVPKRTKLVASEEFDTNATEHPDMNRNKNMKTEVVRFMSVAVVLPVNGP